jgi:WD40 repeat protein
MPNRDDEAFKHEWAAFDADIAAARAALEAGQFNTAVDLAVSPAHKFYYGKDASRFRLLSDLHKLLESPVKVSSYLENPWQAKLMAELYSTWPKLYLEDAILKHSFPEPHVDEQTVSGAESIQLAEHWHSILSNKPLALSLGRRWLKLWELETGKVIRAEEIHKLLKLWLGYWGVDTGKGNGADELPLYLQTCAVGRDSSHVLFAYSLMDSNTGEALWSTSFRETFRQVSCLRAGIYEKSHYENVKYYSVLGEIVGMVRVRGTSDDLKHEVTLKHEAIKDYLPAGTTAFVARSNEHYGLKVDDLSVGDRISAELAVEDDERWLEVIIGPGRGLKSINNRFTTPITALCISSDGSLGLANGNGASFGIWNLWTGDRLREFIGHKDRVTCLCLSVDVGFAVSGAEDMTVRLWKPITAECVRVFEGHESVVTKVCISLDATKILSADYGGVIKLWDIASGMCLRTIHAHGESISGLHFTMDGKFAASGSWDKTVKLWNLSDGSCMRTFEHSDWVTSVDMTQDGRYLVSSSYEGTKVWELLWRLEPREVVKWDEGARPFLEILLNANAAWDGKLGTPVDMAEQDIKDTLRRQGPSWSAWHAPSKKNDWHRVWHLGWDIEATLGHAGYGWLSDGPGDESRKIQDEWSAPGTPDTDAEQE